MAGTNIERTIILTEVRQGKRKEKVVIGRFVINVLDDDYTDVMRVFVMGKTRMAIEV